MIDQQKKTSQKNFTPDQDTQEKEIGGQKGPEPTRFGDWEKNGRVTDF